MTEALLADKRISIWDRVRAFVEQNQLDMAKRIGTRALDANGQAVDQKLLAQAIDRPAAFLTSHERRLTEVQRELAIVAVVRLARDNPQDAAEYAGALNLLLTPEQRGTVWGRIGHMAGLRLMREANDWYLRGGEHVGVGPDSVRVDEVLEWQVRSALRANDWKTVKAVIDRMPATHCARSDLDLLEWAGAAAGGGIGGSAGTVCAYRATVSFLWPTCGRGTCPNDALPPRLTAPTAEEIAPFESNAGFRACLQVL